MTDDSSSFSAKILEDLARILKDTGLSEIEYQKDGVKLRLVKHAKTPDLQTVAAPTPLIPTVTAVPQAPEMPTNLPENLTKKAATGSVITAPMIGTAYLSPDPDAPPFIKPGDAVEKGQTLLIVETMKVMNPIRSPQDGIIEDILVHNAQPVEFGEPLVRFKD